ncbi:hypothetical protein AB0M92_19055 [Streptomyces sp. NPDC051582]|uniref:hypothetical protein n=1 Tax=Streptomyces sp. NPDC051582 TaxID=3155167 RepID=UPI00342AB66A
MADYENDPPKVTELTEAQIDALADAGNRALNDHYHESLCYCSAWPEGCVSSGNYFAGSWDTAAFNIGMRAVIGRWESMRAPAPQLSMDEERIAVIRRRRTHCEAVRGESEDERPVHVWGPSQYPGRDMCQRCTTERAWAEDESADEVVLLAEIDRLRARLAELEALKPAPIQDCRKCGAGYNYGSPCSNCAFQAKMAALIGRPEEGQ